MRKEIKKAISIIATVALAITAVPALTVKADTTPVSVLNSTNKEYAFDLKDYVEDYGIGDEVDIKVNMSSTEYFNGALGTNVGDTWTTEGFDTEGYEDFTITKEWKVVPSTSEIKVQLWSDKDIAVNINSIEVTKTATLHDFTENWKGFETTFSAYCENFVAGKETKVTLTFVRELGVQVGYNKVADEWTTETKTGKVIEYTITPADDYLNIQTTDMAEGTKGGLVSIKVTQGEEATTPKETETTPKAPETTTAPTTTAKEPQTTVQKKKDTSVGKVSVKSASKKKKAKTAKISLKKVTGATGYVVKVSTSKKFKGKVNTYTVKGLSVTAKKLKAKKQYYVKACAYKVVDGKKYYGAWTSAKKIKMK